MVTKEEVECTHNSKQRVDGSSERQADGVMEGKKKGGKTGRREGKGKEERKAGHGGSCL